MRLPQALLGMNWRSGHGEVHRHEVLAASQAGALGYGSLVRQRYSVSAPHWTAAQTERDFRGDDSQPRVVDLAGPGPSSYFSAGNKQPHRPEPQPGPACPPEIRPLQYNLDFWPRLRALQRCCSAAPTSPYRNYIRKQRYFASSTTGFARHDPSTRTTTSSSARDQHPEAGTRPHQLLTDKVISMCDARLNQNPTDKNAFCARLRQRHARCVHHARRPRVYRRRTPGPPARNGAKRPQDRPPVRRRRYGHRHSAVRRRQPSALFCASWSACLAWADQFKGPGASAQRCRRRGHLVESGAQHSASSCATTAVTLRLCRLSAASRSSTRTTSLRARGGRQSPQGRGPRVGVIAEYKRVLANRAAARLLH